MLHVIGTKPQLYHSVRINQERQRAIHVLPEKYQFCSFGQAKSLPERTFPVFGSCTAKVHYGICSDFDVFVVDEGAAQLTPRQDRNITISTNTRYIYSPKTPSIHSPKEPVTVTNSKTVNDGRPLSPLDRSIQARIESYRENIGAALELLNVDEESAQLENLIR